ncbi:hypothetical protein ACIBEJ_23715 [Nonomuraea sp. NPDC050790]|uniref:hypothetical protein n=1 Tax=Nonomuraea sp. NPDC050790 TaxID=3364371 RepID=UPI0037BCB741
MSTLGPRQPLFWWWLAATYALWEIVREVLTPRRRVLCAGQPIVEPVGALRRTAAEIAQMLSDVLYVAGPFLLATIALFLARRAQPRVRLTAAVHAEPRVHLMAAVLGFGLVALPEALAIAADVLKPPAEPPPGCLPDPAPFRILPIALSWLISPLTMIMFAGAAGTRVRPDLGSILRLVAALAVLALAVQAVRILPERLAPPPIADDGTPRYALLATGSLETVDLETGRVAHDYWPRMGRRLANIQAVAATGKPGEYVVSVTLRQGRDTWSPRGVISRLHRLTVDADGQAKLGKALSGRLTGNVDRIRVSPTGRVAYSRKTESRDHQTTTYAGVLNPDALTSDAPAPATLTPHVLNPDTPTPDTPTPNAPTTGAPTPNALTPNAFAPDSPAPDTPAADVLKADVLTRGVEWRVPSYGFYWRDGHTLVLPDDIHFTGVTSPPKPELVKSWEGALDVRKPASEPAGLVRAPRESGSHTLPHPLPDGRTLRVRQGSYEQPSELLLYDGARKVATVLSLKCGEIVSMAADPSGRHLLVGKDNENDSAAGNRPCGGTGHELLRVALTPAATGAFPHKVVWRGGTYPHDITW